MDKLLQKFRALSEVVPGALREEQRIVGLRLDETGKVLTVTVLDDEARSAAENVLGSESSFRAAVEAAEVSVKVVVGGIAVLHATQAGSAGFGAGLSSYGTLGWFIYLDSELVCVSNHHVLCSGGDQTPIGTVVYAGQPWGSPTRVGTLHSFDRLGTASPRLFDFALAAIDDRDLVDFKFRSCDDGSLLAYPRRLAFKDELNESSTYATVGARPPACAQGKFRGYASIQVGVFPDGRIYSFTEQLVFEPISKPGDSGSIVLNLNTGNVVGLIFAGSQDGQFSYANPLYRKGWRYIGTKAVGDLDVPEFTTEGEPDRGTLAAQPMSPPNLSSPGLPPIFDPGKTITFYPSLSEFRSSFQRVWSVGVKVDQCYGDWIALDCQISGPPSTPTSARAWMHAVTGVVYSA